MQKNLENIQNMEQKPIDSSFEKTKINEEFNYKQKEQTGIIKK